MLRNLAASLLVLSLLSSAINASSASPTPPVKILSNVVSNVVSSLVKYLWSLKSTTKTAISSSRSMMKFESGYTVETVFDGSKMGIEPFSVQVTPNGQILVLDSENSNIFRISTPLSRYSRPKLVAGSPEGNSGHVDGRPREARLNHPKGLTLDDKGNIYVADTMNMAIRKISDSGVSTIAGGKWSRGGSHVDGPSEDAKFSNDFDVVYLGSSCSLLVVDRGNQAIREIQLNDEDCSYHYDTSFHLGIAVLVAATFFGYMLALLQRRVRMMFTSEDVSHTPQILDTNSQNYPNPGNKIYYSRKDLKPPMTRAMPIAPYRNPPKFVRPPLIPPEDEPERQEEGFFGSLGRLVLNTGSSVSEIFRKKPQRYQIHQQYHQPMKYSNQWPMQESFVIPDGDEPPAIETRAPAPKRAHKELGQQSHHAKQSRTYYNEWDGERFQHQNQQQNHHRQSSAAPETCYEQGGETNEIVFGAVQEQSGRCEAVVIKAVDYSDPVYNRHNVRPRVNYNYTGYSNAY